MDADAGDAFKTWMVRIAVVAISAGLGGGGAELHHGNGDALMQKQLDSQAEQLATQAVALAAETQHVKDLERQVARLEERLYARGRP